MSKSGPGTGAGIVHRVYNGFADKVKPIYELFNAEPPAYDYWKKGMIKSSIWFGALILVGGAISFVVDARKKS